MSLKKKTRLRKKLPPTNEAKLRAIIQRITAERISLPLTPKNFTLGQTNLGEYFAARQCLVLTDDAAEIASLEAFTGETQSEIIEDFIEDSCCSEDLPQYVGGHGTAAERMKALRAVFTAEEENE